MSGDLWINQDLPVLRHTADLLVIEGEDVADHHMVAERASVDVQDVLASHVRLYHAEYVGGVSLDGATGEQVIVYNVTERGLRAVELWPSESDGRALIEAIEKAAEQEVDAKTKKSLREMAASARNIGEGTLASIAAAVVTRMTMGQ